MLPVFGLLYLHTPHGIPFAVRVLPFFRKLIQPAGVVFRQLHLLQQLFPQVAFGDFPFEEIQVARRIVAGLPFSLHERRFPDLVHGPDIEVIILAGFDTAAGRNPVQRGAEITRIGFHLAGIGNLRICKPEFILHRGVIYRLARGGGYLKIAGSQLNIRRYCRRGDAEIRAGRIALLALAVHRPHRQGVTSRRQVTESMLRFCQDQAAGQPVAVIFRFHRQAQGEVNPLNHTRGIPSRPRLILPLLCQNLCGQVLHGRQRIRDTGVR